MKLSKAARCILRNLAGQADQIASEVIRERGGSAANVREAGQRVPIMIANSRHIKDLEPLLLPPRDEAYRLHDVHERILYGCRDEIILDLGDCFLQFGVDADTDTMTAQFHEQQFRPKRSYRSIRSDAPWKDYLNEECGWTWFAINQQGYWDSVLISFDAVVPNVLLNVMASSIYVFTIGPMINVVAKKTTKPGKQNTNVARRVGLKVLEKKRI